MSLFEDGVTGSPRDAPEGKWLLGGGIEILCTYKCMEELTKKLSAQKNIRTGLKAGSTLR